MLLQFLSCLQLYKSVFTVAPSVALFHKKTFILRFFFMKKDGLSPSHRFIGYSSSINLFCGVDTNSQQQLWEKLIYQLPCKASLFPP